MVSEKYDMQVRIATWDGSNMELTAMFLDMYLRTSVRTSTHSASSPEEAHAAGFLIPSSELCLRHNPRLAHFLHPEYPPFSANLRPMSGTQDRHTKLCTRATLAHPRSSTLIQFTVLLPGVQAKIAWCPEAQWAGLTGPFSAEPIGDLFTMRLGQGIWNKSNPNDAQI